MDYLCTHNCVDCGNAVQNANKRQKSARILIHTISHTQTYGHINKNAHSRWESIGIDCQSNTGDHRTIGNTKMTKRQDKQQALNGNY